MNDIEFIDETVGVEEVAKFLNCSAAKVRELARELKGAKIGRAWVFEKENVRAYLELKQSSHRSARVFPRSRRPVIINHSREHSDTVSILRKMAEEMKVPKQKCR